ERVGELPLRCSAEGRSRRGRRNLDRRCQGFAGSNCFLPAGGHPLETRLWGEQRRVFSKLPGFEHAEVFRMGQIHRNTFIDAPRLLGPVAIGAAPWTTAVSECGARG